MYDPVNAFPNSGNEIKEYPPVSVVEEDRFAPVSAAGQAVERAGKRKTKGSGYTREPSARESKGKTCSIPAPGQLNGDPIPALTPRPQTLSYYNNNRRMSPRSSRSRLVNRTLSAPSTTRWS